MKNTLFTLAVFMVWLGSSIALAEEDALVATEIPTITPLMANGPNSNRVNIVFLSEAYIASQKETYFNDVNIAIEEMFKYSPYKEYKKYFNVWSVWVASEDSLLAVVKRGEETRTYFGEWGGLSPSLSKIDNVSRSFFGKDDPIVVILLVNDERISGGASQPDRVSFLGLASVGPNIMRRYPFYSKEIFADINTHEVSHAFAGLADEYSGFAVLKPSVKDIEISWPFREIPPNVTTENNRDLIKWKSWISVDVPIPTPSSISYVDEVGLFEGAGSYANGLYKPKQVCAMGEYDRNSERLPPFCQVCREAIVKTIAKYVDPTAELVSDVGENTTVFSINPPEPSDHNLSVQWKVDGQVAATGATSFPATDTEIGYGRHKLSVEVVDTTSFVRYDPDKLLVKFKEWDVISLPLPDFTGDGVVDFNDFFQFADHFGQESTTAEIQKYDLDWDGKIGFGDFFLFADSFGKSISKKQIFGITSSSGVK